MGSKMAKHIQKRAVARLSALVLFAALYCSFASIDTWLLAPARSAPADAREPGPFAWRGALARASVFDGTD